MIGWRNVYPIRCTSKVRRKLIDGVRPAYPKLSLKVLSVSFPPLTTTTRRVNRGRLMGAFRLLNVFLRLARTHLIFWTRSLRTSNSTILRGRSFEKHEGNSRGCTIQCVYMYCPRKSIRMIRSMRHGTILGAILDSSKTPVKIWEIWEARGLGSPHNWRARADRLQPRSLLVDRDGGAHDIRRWLWDLMYENYLPGWGIPSSRGMDSRRFRAIQDM